MVTRYLKGLVAVVLVALLSGAYAPPAKAAVDVSFDFFYSNLGRHGSWQVSGQYGQVWQPAEYGPGWNPYYDGHWVYTDLGWTWVSDYEWGDVCYHYGTWVDDPGFGWVWVPGYTWAPSWVVFRTGPDYIGWAPVSPGFSIGASFEIGGGGGPFVFVSAGDFLAPRIRTYAVPESRTTVIINRTKIVNNNIRIENNVVVNRGPDVSIVERASGHKVRQERIENVPRAAPGGRVTRDKLTIDPQKMRNGGVKAAEPARQNLPEQGVPGGGRGKARDRNRPEQPEATQPRQPEATQPARPEQPRQAEPRQPRPDQRARPNQPKPNQPTPNQPAPRKQRKRKPPQEKPTPPPPDTSSMKSSESAARERSTRADTQRAMPAREPASANDRQVAPARKRSSPNSPVVGASSRSNSSRREQGPAPDTKKRKHSRGERPAPSHSGR